MSVPWIQNTWLELKEVPMVNLTSWVSEPAGMVTLAGTVATAGLSLERETMAPPVRADPLSVTLPVEGDPPLTLVGFSASEVRVGGGVTVREAV